MIHFHALAELIMPAYSLHGTQSRASRLIEDARISITNGCAHALLFHVHALSVAKMDMVQ